MKSKNTTGFNIQPAVGIRWLRNSGEIVIINDDLSKRWVLQDIEVDVWEWLCQEFNHESIIKMIALINHSTEVQALQLFNEISAIWEEQGFIKRTQTD